MPTYYVCYSTGTLQGVVEDVTGAPVSHPTLEAANAAARAEFAAMADLDVTDQIVPQASFTDGRISLTDAQGSAPDLAVWVEAEEE